ncbi:MAG: alpha/beta fold hydrolase [Ilumatobacteraceae bacterium]
MKAYGRVRLLDHSAEEHWNAADPRSLFSPREVSVKPCAAAPERGIMRCRVRMCSAFRLSALTCRPRFTFDVWTRQLAGTLAVLGIEHATVIGQSLGGAVVTSFAGDYPASVDRVVSVASGPWINPAMIPMLSAHYVNHLVDRRGYWPDRPDQGVAYWTRLRDVYRIEGTRKDLAAIVRGQFLDGRNYFRSIANVRCPTLLIHGGADRIIPTRAARTLAPQTHTRQQDGRCRERWSLRHAGRSPTLRI